MFFKVIFISICVFYLLRLLFMGIVGNYAAKLNEKTRRHYEEKLRDAERRASQSGSIHIDIPNNKKKTYSKSDGEYVDYEEIK